MANTINWGRIYCFTEFGDEDNTIAESIPSFSSPECFYCHYQEIELKQKHLL